MSGERPLYIGVAISLPPRVKKRRTSCRERNKAEHERIIMKRKIGRIRADSRSLRTQNGRCRIDSTQKTGRMIGNVRAENRRIRNVYTKVTEWRIGGYRLFIRRKRNGEWVLPSLRIGTVDPNDGSC